MAVAQAIGVCPSAEGCSAAKVASCKLFLRALYAWCRRSRRSSFSRSANFLSPSMISNIRCAICIRLMVLSLWTLLTCIKASSVAHAHVVPSSLLEIPWIFLTISSHRSSSSASGNSFSKRWVLAIRFSRSSVFLRIMWERKGDWGFLKRRNGM